ncbi:hypothetical protein ACI8AF_26225 [Blastococcus sp. SYSU D00669]
MSRSTLPRTLLLRAGVPLAAVAALALPGAISASAGTVPYTSYPLSADGWTDAFAVDDDGDGADDTWVLDGDADGSTEAVAVDRDGDARPEVWAFDRDADGAVEEVAVDSDGDGTADATAADTDRDGRLDAGTASPVVADAFAEAVIWDWWAPAFVPGGPGTTPAPAATV